MTVRTVLGRWADPEELARGKFTVTSGPAGDHS